MSKSQIFKFISVFQLIFASLICIYCSSQENIKLPDVGIDFVDKLFHFFAFIIYGFSLQTAICATCNFHPKKIKLIVLISGAIFAMSDEIHQMFVPGRSADILDWIVDVCGVAISLLFFNFIKNTINKSPRL